MVACLIPVLACAQTSLEYQNRGDRHEGVRSRPVSGFELELISALIDQPQPAAKLPAQLKVRFFLEQASAVYLTVRELDVKHYYWLDQARPAKPWARGFHNEFSWPTDVVLGRLGLPPAELGVVARLECPKPSTSEHVAPVVLYHGRPPAAVHEYVFVFRSSADARLTYAVHRDGQATALASGGPLRPRGGRPFEVRWDASKVSAGAYRLVLVGYRLDDNHHLHQTVRFFHEPAIP